MAEAVVAMLSLESWELGFLLRSDDDDDDDDDLASPWEEEEGFDMVWRTHWS
jgi:hypothetical protein